jgi:23S rRNA (cytosine1962-C5)-methyltransferase
MQEVYPQNLSYSRVVPDLSALLNNIPKLEELLLNARAKRLSLEQNPNMTAFRLVNSSADEITDLSLDFFAGVLVASLYTELSEKQENSLLEVLAATFKPRAIYLKRRPKEARHVANVDRDSLAPDTPAWGEQIDEIEILENGVKYLIRPGGDLSVGLFLDMREPRAWLKHHSAGKTVLNTFSYTCGFGLISSLSGATRAVNLDLSRRVLDWGEENYRLNKLEPKRFDFISGDVFDWLNRFSRREDKFDAVILDPPSFATSKNGRFSAAANYDELVTLASSIVAPDGLLLACCNLAQLSRRDFYAQIKVGLKRAGRGFNLLESLGQSKIDFPTPANLESPLKVFALEL